MNLGLGLAIRSLIYQRSGSESWTPASLFASSEEGAWYDPSDLSTLWQDTAGTIPVTADGQAVARMDDKSGNGNHLTQGTAANRPLYKTDGTLHWLLFDGSNDNLASGAFDLSASDELTHSLALEITSSGSNQTLSRLGDANSAGEFAVNISPDEEWNTTIRGSAATAEAYALWTLPPGEAIKYVATQLGKISTDTNQLRLDGEVFVEDAGDLGTGNFASSSTYLIGETTNSINGKFYGCVITGALVSGDDLTSLESYLRGKAGHAWTFTTGGMSVSVFDGAMNVYTPLSTSQTDKYFMWRQQEYDTSSDPAGGGIGTVFEDIYYCTRRSQSVFAEIHRLTDVGLNEFAMKKDDGTDTNIGHDLHGGMARRAAPVFKIDDVVQTVDVRADFHDVSKVEWIEYFELYDRLDGTTVIGHLDTYRTWENGVMKLKQVWTALTELDLLTLYLFMFSLYDQPDNGAEAELTVDEWIMPDQGGAEYTPGSGVNSTYPSESHFIGRSSYWGWEFDVEVKTSVPAEFRSWIQGGTTSRKIYMSYIGQHDDFGLVAERTAYTVPDTTEYTMETWISPTLDIAVDTTAPVLSSATDVANGSDAATLGVTTDEANGRLYWVVTSSATAPSAAQVQAGQDHTGSAATASGDQVVSATGAISGIAATGLTAETTYYAHFCHVDSSANASNIASGDGFTTDAATAFSVLDLFAGGEDGVWYEPGPTTVLKNGGSKDGSHYAAAGDLVQIILDKSKELALGSELAAAGINTSSNWIASGTNTVEQDGSEVKITYVDNANGANIPLTTASGALSSSMVNGGVYRVQGTCRTNSGGNVRAFIGTATAPSSQEITFTETSATSFEFVYMSDGSEIFRINTMSTGEIAWVQITSVKQILGTHANAANFSGYRPTLEQDGSSNYYVNFDGVGDVVNVQNPDLGTAATLATSTSGTGGTILQNQTIGATTTITSDFYGYVLLDRALTAGEESDLDSYLDGLAGV